MSIMLRVLTMLLVGYGCGHHHHPLSCTLFWVSVWKAVLSPKACSENLKGIVTMLVVLVLLLLTDVGDHYHLSPSHALSWVLVWKPFVTPKPRSENVRWHGNHADGADAAAGW